MNWIMPIYSTVVGLTIGTLATLVSSKSKSIKEKDESWKAEHKALLKGMAFLLRAELERAHREYVVDGHITSSELEEVKDIYETYHSLGGNGVGTKIYEEIKSLKIKD